MRRLAALALVVAGGLLGSTAPASAEVGDLTFAGCLANNAAQGCADLPNSPLAGIGGDKVVVSPDGRNVYVAALTPSEGILSTFNRAPDGSLTYAGCIADTPAQGCTDLSGSPLSGLSDIAVSPDGDSVYAAAVFARSLLHFTRGGDGSLVLEKCISDSEPGCQDPAGANSPLYNVLRVAVSPDGGTVYTQSEPPGGVGGAVQTFSAAADGSPTYVGCVGDNAGEGCTDLGSGSLIGRGGLIATASSLYALGSGTYTINRLNRSPLSFGQCISGIAVSGCSTAPASPSRMSNGVISPDGTSLYTAGYDTGPGVLTHLSLAADGQMTYRDCLADSDPGCVDIPNSPIQGATDLAISPDGASIYVTGRGSDDVATFRRATDGSLAYAGCQANDLTQGCAVVPGGPLDGTTGVAVSPDGANVYVVAGNSESLSIFKRETPGSGFSLDLSARGKQKVGKLLVRALCSADCNVEISAKGKARKKFKSKVAEADLPGGEPTRLKVKLKRSVLRKVDDHKGKVRFTATATSTTGATAADTAKSKLKP